MSDEQEKVDAGSETSSEATADTSADTANAGGAAETTTESTGSETSSEATADTSATDTQTDASRTGYAEKGLRAGDACICPDGRNGTVHQYDAGLICIPNQDQG